MMKNDKLVVAIGVVMVVLASIGIYLWNPTTTGQKTADIEHFFEISSLMKNEPESISVSDCSPFYPLIVTPLAIHYDDDNVQTVHPLYITNYTSPSRAILRAVDQIGIPVTVYIDNEKTPKQWSVDLAEMFWEESEAAVLIHNSEKGYNLGVLATPIASYLEIPVIVTDEIDTDIQQTLGMLGVQKTIICGNLDSYGTSLRFSTAEEVVNASIELVRQKFGSIDYLSITNPIDAWPPEVLDREEFTLGPKTMTTKATTELINSFKADDSVVGTFTIPDDYKYALVKLTGENLHIEHVEELGDNVIFSCGPISDNLDIPSGLRSFEVYAGGTSGGGIPIRNAQGEIMRDITYNEAVLYGRGGVEYQVTARPNWLASDTGEVRAEVIVERLSDPYYPMMKDLSTVAPYLTAYRQGILYGKPEYAFAAGDDVLYGGEPLPGFYMPRRNPDLTEPANQHVMQIHEDINKLLTTLAEIEVEKEYDIKNLQSYYQQNPIHIALVGGATVLPQLIYDNPIDPLYPPEAVPYYFGGGVPSDVIYGNIDPDPDDFWSSQAPDMYTEYPYQENIVGRITGWDAQDASALITRTIYYQDIIDDLGDWKDTAVLQMGGGNDFQKPFIRYKIFGELLNLIKRGEPMKLETGASYFNGLALKNNVFEPMGFDITYIRENKATYQGFSEEAIQLLKQANLLNKLLLSPRQIRTELGEGVVQGKELQEGSNFILANAHGNQHMFGMGDVGIYKLGLGLPNGLLPRVLEKIATIVGFGPGLSLSDHGYYSTRNVENMNLGPSFLWIESCICGKIDGVYPQQGLSQAYIHSGCNAVIASTTSSNVPGGYLEPKQTKYDFPGQTFYRYLLAKSNAQKGIYPDQHFGFKIYSDLGEELMGEDISLGEAFRNAKNRYLPEDANWEVWWSPPLIYTGMRDVDQQIQQNLAATAAEGPEGLDPRLDNKFMSYQEYALYGDPAFVPYVPYNN